MTILPFQSVGSFPAANPENNLQGTQTFTLTTFLIFSPPFMVLDYRNNLDFSVMGTVYCVVHASTGQTVYYNTTAVNVAGGGNVVTQLSVAGLPPGNYNASLFTVTPSGVAISDVSTIAFSS